MSDSDPSDAAPAPVAVITGSAQGIGATIVAMARAQGWRVAALDIQPVEDPDSDPDLLHLQVDISNEASVITAMARTEQHFGRVDALVSAAALFTALEHKPFTEIDADEWDRVFKVNVRGPFLLSKHVAPLLKRAGGGAIVYFSSNVVSFGMAEFLHYVSSKAAIVGMTRSLARELGPNDIRVNAVAPGFVTTEVTERERSQDYRSALVARQAIPIPTVAEEICSTVMFLISSTSRAITGQTILINRGSHMGAA